MPSGQKRTRELFQRLKHFYEYRAREIANLPIIRDRQPAAPANDSCSWAGKSKLQMIL